MPQTQMRFQQGGNTNATLDQRVVHLARQPIALAEYRLESCPKLLQSEFVDAPNQRREAKNAQTHKPYSPIEMRPLNNIHRGLGDFFGIVHLKSSNPKLVIAGGKVGVVPDPPGGPLLPAAIKTAQPVAKAPSPLPN